MNNTFFELYIDGKVNLDDIHDYIEEWHEGNSDLELHEYLGLTYEQYCEWVKTDTL